MSARSNEFDIGKDQVVALDEERYMSMIPEKIRAVVDHKRDNPFIQMVLVNYCTQRQGMVIEKREELFHFNEKKFNSFPLSVDEMEGIIEFQEQWELHDLADTWNKCIDDPEFYLDLFMEYPSIYDRLDMMFNDRSGDVMLTEEEKAALLKGGQ